MNIVFLEWYLYVEDGKPTEVYAVKSDAIARLTHGAKLNESERKLIQKYAETNMPPISERLTVVGTYGNPGQEKDRIIMRISGPNSYEMDHFKRKAELKAKQAEEDAARIAALPENDGG